MNIIKTERNNSLNMFGSERRYFKRIVRSMVCVLLLTSTTPATAQQRLADHNTIGWLVYTGTFQVKPRLSLHTEYQWRRVNLLKSWQQSLIRGGINYAVRKDISLHAGYAFAETFPYGNFPVTTAFPEHRIYQQILLKNPIGIADVSHRFTLEQRFLGNITTIDNRENLTWFFLNRMRYRVKVEIPINKKGWTLALQDELFIGWGKNIGANIFDQNRVGLLLGYKVNQSVKFEAGYISQILQQAKRVNDKAVFQYNSGFMLASHLSF